MKTKFTLILLVLSISLTNLLNAQSGNVFNDLNGNGTKDAGEPGVGGIVVKSFRQNESLFGTAVTDVDGNYTLNPVAITNQRLRIEFSIPSAMSSYKPSTKGMVYGSSVRFVNGNKANTNFAVTNPSAVLDGDPILVHSRFVFGNQTSGQFKDSCVLFGVRNSWGTSNNTSGSFEHWNTNSPYRIAFANEIGSVYGIVYSKKRNKIFTSAFFRQYSGFGPNGPGAIYQIPYNYQTGNRTAAPSLMVDVTTLTGQAMPADPHGTDIPLNWATQAMNSDTRMSLVTKYSLGDLEISADESKLYTINLYNREVVAINPDNGTLVNRWAVPTTGLINSVGAVNSNDVRPFGLGYRNGRLYVGAVSTGQATQTNNGTAAGAIGNDNALHAYIWELNEQTNTFTLVLNFNIKNSSESWFTWQDSWNNGVRLIDPTTTYTIRQAQPVLSDIDFYGDDMIVGLRNRLNDQWGLTNFDPVINENIYTYKAGDILGAKFNYNTNKFELETNGTIGGRVATGNVGANTGYNEFYRGDGATQNGWNSYFDNATGSFVQVNGGHLASLQNFPSFSFNAWPNSDQAGVTWINNQNGTAVKGMATYLGAMWSCPGGKSNGMGSIEAIADAMPIEVGNRVWYDTDGNGLQSAEEDGIANVSLQLLNQAGTVVLGTTTTDLQGDYIFNETNVTGGIQPNTTYKVRINPTQFATSGGLGILGGMNLAPSNISTAGMPGVSDNDAVLVSGLAVATIVTNAAGESIHDLDFGLKSSILSVATITKFTAAKRTNDVMLAWETSYEEDLASFEVERSTDGTQWTKIATVAASINSSTIKNYSTIDIAPVKVKNNLYRLKQVGTDGSFKYSEIRTVKMTNEGTLTVFPNPAKTTTTVTLPANLTSEVLSINIVNQSGQTVKQVNVVRGATQQSINLIGLPVATYNVTLTNTNSILHTAKLQIVQ